MALRFDDPEKEKEFLNVGTFTPSPMDLGTIEGYTQKFAAPGIRNIRRGLRESLSDYYDNPMERRFAAEGAFRGYGDSLERLMSGARRDALSAYLPEYNTFNRQQELEWMETRRREGELHREDRTDELSLSMRPPFQQQNRRLPTQYGSPNFGLTDDGFSERFANRLFPFGRGNGGLRNDLGEEKKDKSSLFSDIKTTSL